MKRNQVSHALVAAGILLIGVLPMSLLPNAAAGPSAKTTTGVSSIYQTPTYVTEQSSFTVWMKVTDSSQIKLVYFTFCQLTSSLCYLPINMDPRGNNWYAGTTKPMTSYHGMNVGVRAGYNITIEFNDSSNMTEPSLPNHFANLTVAQTVVGWYEYEMVVSDHLYSLSGVVTDSATGRGVAGAQVSLAPGNNSTVTNSSGGYAFSRLLNGTYTVSVTQAGYHENNVTVQVSGQNASRDVLLANSSLPNGNPNPQTRPAGNFLTSTIGMVAVGLAAAAIVVAAVLLWRRSRRRPPAQKADATSSQERAPNQTE